MEILSLKNSQFTLGKILPIMANAFVTKSHAIVEISGAEFSHREYIWQAICSTWVEGLILEVKHFINYNYSFKYFKSFLENYATQSSMISSDAFPVLYKFLFLVTASNKFKFMS